MEPGTLLQDVRRFLADLRVELPEVFRSTRAPVPAPPRNGHRPDPIFPNTTSNINTLDSPPPATSMTEPDRSLIPAAFPPTTEPIPKPAPPNKNSDTGSLELPLPSHSPDGNRSLPNREQARAVIARRVEFWSGRIGVDYGRISIRDQKTLWGSCSRHGNLNFNWRLILAPPEVLDYVVIHELCHRLEMNHSRKFWHHVNGWCPDHRLLRRWLRTNAEKLKSRHALLDLR